MTVSTQVSRNEYTGNGVTTQYDFTFRILDKSHLLVQTLDAAENITTLTLGSDYSVTGVNRYPGGKVVLTIALPAGYKISIERKTPVTQETSIRNQGGFFPEIHEDAFDKLTMLVQQVYGWWSGLALKKPSWLANYYDAMNNRIRNLRDPSQAQDAATKGYADNLYQGAISHSDNNFKRTLRVPESEVGMLPGISGRRKKILAFNDTGNPIAVLPESGSAADVMIDLASSDGFKYIGQVPGIGALRNLRGSYGDRVLVSGYYAGSNLGGGEFYYDSSKSNIDNGVTIFSGWVRVVKNKTLTTYDAGMVPGDGSNATAKMRALANALEDGYTLLGFGKHLTNDNVIFDGKSGITVVNGGDFCISAKELRDSWVHHGWTGNELPDAVLYARFCPGFKAIGFKVIGAKSWYSGYAPEQTYEMGDAGIRLHNCPGSLVEKCDISHVFTWPVYSEYGDDNIARFNKISDCARQSGINLTAYSSGVKIYGNEISDCALYAVEMENFPNVASPVPTKYAFCGYNLIRRCGRAIAVVGNIIEADIVGNVAHDSYGGVFTRTGAYSKNINIEDNTLKNCQNSYEITSSSNVFVNGGEVSAYNDPQWLYTSQYDAIMKWGNDRSKFYTHGWSPLAQAFLLGNVTSLAVWINGVQYTAVSGVRDDSVTLGTNGGISYSCLITLSAVLPESVELYTSVGYIL
ncbi:TPA: right-handed parallel beta-helix repeat-containing protein, partial [Raoultella ornithinolytica]